MLDLGGFAIERKATAPLIIGEVGQAHDGSLGTAHALVDVIADAGAQAVKFQTHLACFESTPSEPWRVQFSKQDASRYDYWKRMEFTEDQWRGLRKHADERGLVFISSPFSLESVSLLADIGADALKIASGEVANTDLLRACAATGLPVLVSSGMSPWAELDAAVAILEESSAPYAVMQCTSAYPCPPGDWGLNVLQDIRSRYGCDAGFSDHSGSEAAGLAAVALGARYVEVHVTLSKAAFGPDVPASLTPKQLKRLCDGAAAITQALDAPIDKDAAASRLAPMRALFTRSVVAVRDLPADTILTDVDLVAKKPGTGIPGSELPNVVGRRLRHAVTTDQLLSWEDLHE